MAQDNSKTTLTRLTQGLVVVLITLSFSLSSWTAVKAIALDKEVSAMRAQNTEAHIGFNRVDVDLKEDFNSILTEQRSMSRKLDRTHTAVIKIAAKMDIDTSP